MVEKTYIKSDGLGLAMLFALLSGIDCKRVQEMEERLKSDVLDEVSRKTPFFSHFRAEVFSPWLEVLLCLNAGSTIHRVMNLRVLLSGF